MTNSNIKYISEFERELANGMRMYGFAPLSENEIIFIKKEAKRIKVDVSILRFNVPDHLARTCYDYKSDVIYIGRNIFPDEKFGGTNPRDLLSVACVLAHEYYGHRLNREEYLYDAENHIKTKLYWEDECRASITAAHITPGLTDVERSMLIQDARQRAADARQVLEMTSSMRRLLHGYGLPESGKEIVPPIALVFHPRPSLAREGRNRSSKSSLSRMRGSTGRDDRGPVQGTDDYSL